MFVAGMTDADAHAAIVRSERRGDRTRTVVSSIAAAALDLQLSGGKGDLVMQHDDRCERQLEELHRRAERAAALVHEGGRLQKVGLAAGEFAFAEHAVKARAPGAERVARVNRVER